MAAAEHRLPLFDGLRQHRYRRNVTFRSQTVTVATKGLLTFSDDRSRRELKAEIPLQRWPVTDNALYSDP